MKLPKYSRRSSFYISSESICSKSTLTLKAETCKRCWAHRRKKWDSLPSHLRWQIKMENQYIDLCNWEVYRSLTWGMVQSKVRNLSSSNFQLFFLCITLFSGRLLRFYGWEGIEEFWGYSRFFLDSSNKTPGAHIHWASSNNNCYSHLFEAFTIFLTSSVGNVEVQCVSPCTTCYHLEESLLGNYYHFVFLLYMLPHN